MITPRLPDGWAEDRAFPALRELLDAFMSENAVADYALWYYTPMMAGFTDHLTPRLIVYDCMDELSLFKGAPPELHERERMLFDRAHLVFTGGQSLYEAKKNQHSDVHAFPSSVDVMHFAQARDEIAEPADQAGIPHPRVGFCGVVDERMDLDLLAGIAAARPDYHFVMIGPVVKIHPDTLPRRENIHYLGGKSYKELPAYIGGWDAAMMPFAHNDSTRFISPTKTPEYLAAGRPVVSTSIRDVVRPYGEQGLVQIGDTVEDFAAGVDRALGMNGSRPGWLMQVDDFLKDMSWDRTWSRMANLMASKLDRSSSLVKMPAIRTSKIQPAFDYLIAGAGFAGSRDRGAHGESWLPRDAGGPAGRTWAAMRTITTIATAFSSISTVRISFIPTRAMCLTTCRGLRSGGRTNIAYSRRWTTNWCRFRSTWIR